MELRFLSPNTIIDVQAYSGKIEIENLRYEFMCRFVGVHTGASLLVKSGEISDNLEILADNHILAFTFFRGAHGYSFTGKIGSTELIDECVLIDVMTPVEQYNRRKNPRIDVFAPVSIFEISDEGEKGEVIATETVLDVSSGGISVATNTKLDEVIQVGKEYFLDFRIDNRFFSMRSNLVHSGYCRNLFTYKFLHAFEFQDVAEPIRLVDALFNYGLKGR